jgi:hypothetical protein
MSRHEDDARARAVGRVDQPERMVLEHRLVERHRDVLLGLEANRRADLLRARQRRKVDRAHDDALVGDAHSDALGKLVLVEHLAKHCGERVDVDDLTIADDAGRERRGRRALNRGAAGRRLHRGHVARFDRKTDD